MAKKARVILWSAKRKFDGKLFEVYAKEESVVAARRKAKKARGEGYLARITKARSAYIIWARKRKK